MIFGLCKLTSEFCETACACNVGKTGFSWDMETNSVLIFLVVFLIDPSQKHSKIWCLTATNCSSITNNINPLPVLFKSLLHAQEGCVFFSGHLNLCTTPEIGLPSRKKIITIKLK
jgi:hypothetical protein